MYAASSSTQPTALWIVGLAFVASMVALYVGLRRKAAIAARSSTTGPTQRPTRSPLVPPVITPESFEGPAEQKPESLVMDSCLSSYPALSPRQLTQLVWMVLAFNNKGSISLRHLSTMADDITFEILSNALARMGGYSNMNEVPDEEDELKKLVARLVSSNYMLTVRTFKGQLRLVEMLMRDYHIMVSGTLKAQSIELLPDNNTLRTLGNVADFDALTIENLTLSCHWLYGFRGLGPAAFVERDQLPCLQDAEYALLMLRITQTARESGNNIAHHGIYNADNAELVSQQLSYTEHLIVHAELIRELHYAALSVMDLDTPQGPARLATVPSREFIESLCRINMRMSLAALEAR